MDSRPERGISIARARRRPGSASFLRTGACIHERVPDVDCSRVAARDRSGVSSGPRTTPAKAARAEEKASRAATAKAKVPAPEGPFLVKPYLQLGHTQAPGKLVLMWHAADADADWTVEYRPGPGTRGRPPRPLGASRVAVAGIEPHRVYHAPLTGLEPGEMFAYRVSRGGKVVFEAEARAPKVARQPQRFVVFGDCGAGTPEQKAIAYRAFLSRPDYVMITGDIVYGKGLISEYRDKFWPIYNADEPSPGSGVPLAPLDPLRRRARQPRHRLPRPGEDARRPRLLLLLVASR